MQNAIVREPAAYGGSYHARASSTPRSGEVIVIHDDSTLPDVKANETIVDVSPEMAKWHAEHVPSLVMRVWVTGKRQMIHATWAPGLTEQVTRKERAAKDEQDRAVATLYYTARLLALTIATEDAERIIMERVGEGEAKN